MANNKTKRNWPALCHAFVYSLPFLLLTQSPAALAVIFGTHFLIDRFRLARFVVYAKNRLLAPDEGVSWYDDFHMQMFGDHEPNPETAERAQKGRQWEARWAWSNCSGTGYPSDTPPWLAVWLLIAADNTLHIAINYAAIRWL
jgi:hypothetical protein